MFIPGIDTVGGFSICSSPIHLAKTGELSLCIKKSEKNHPPAEWVHRRVSFKIYSRYYSLFRTHILLYCCFTSQSKVGSKVSIRVGGDFFLDTDDHSMAGKNILLVGGGVGINPLISIITQLQDYRKGVGRTILKSCLIYSAKTKAELLFMVIAQYAHCTL